MNFFWRDTERRRRDGNDEAAEPTSPFSLMSLPDEAGAFYDQLNKEIEGLRASVDSQLRDMVEASRRDISLLENKLRDIQSWEESSSVVPSSWYGSTTTSPMQSADSNMTEQRGNLSHQQQNRPTGFPLSPSEEARLVGILRTESIPEGREDDQDSAGAAERFNDYVEDRILSNRIFSKGLDLEKIQASCPSYQQAADFDPVAASDYLFNAIRVTNEEEKAVDAIDLARVTRQTPTPDKFQTHYQAHDFMQVDSSSIPDGSKNKDSIERNRQEPKTERKGKSSLTRIWGNVRSRFGSRDNVDSESSHPVPTLTDSNDDAVLRQRKALNRPRTLQNDVEVIDVEKIKESREGESAVEYRGLLLSGVNTEQGLERKEDPPIDKKKVSSNPFYAFRFHFNQNKEEKRRGDDPSERIAYLPSPDSGAVSPSGASEPNTLDDPSERIPYHASPVSNALPVHGETILNTQGDVLPVVSNPQSDSSLLHSQSEHENKVDVHSTLLTKLETTQDHLSEANDGPVGDQTQKHNHSAVATDTTPNKEKGSENNGEEADLDKCFREIVSEMNKARESLSAEKDKNNRGLFASASNLSEEIDTLLTQQSSMKEKEKIVHIEEEKNDKQNTEERLSLLPARLSAGNASTGGTRTAEDSTYGPNNESSRNRKFIEPASLANNLSSTDDGYNTEISSALVEWSPPKEIPLVPTRKFRGYPRQPSPERLMRARTIVFQHRPRSLLSFSSDFAEDSGRENERRRRRKKKTKNLSVETEPETFGTEIVPHVGGHVVSVSATKLGTYVVGADAVSLKETAQNGEMMLLSEVQGKLIKDPYGDEGRYTGILLEGLPHGEGRMDYADGRWYSGEWRHGRWHGQGKAQFVNGDTFNGRYERDRRHGKGRYEWADGRVYDGEFVRNQRDGYGSYTWPDGASYVGGFANGQRHGEGRYCFADGSVYKGEWKNGKYDGIGECVWASGRKYHGEWHAGKAEGYGVEYRADGSIRHEGEWKNDRPLRNRVDP